MQKMWSGNISLVTRLHGLHKVISIWIIISINFFCSTVTWYVHNKKWSVWCGNINVTKIVAMYVPALNYQLENCDGLYNVEYWNDVSILKWLGHVDAFTASRQWLVTWAGWCPSVWECSRSQCATSLQVYCSAASRGPQDTACPASESWSWAGCLRWCGTASAEVRRVHVCTTTVHPVL